jgi:signal peptide peptidase SppA
MIASSEMLPHLVNRPLALLPAFALSPRSSTRDTTPGLAASVAIIPIVGCLTSDDAGWGWGMQSYNSIRHTFMAAVHADDVSAIALIVDSPGGTVANCFDLADTIYAARGIKPIRAILAEDAYSAAYALASAADSITVPRTGGTGSVGIIRLHPNISGMLAKTGVEMSLFRYGDRKMESNPFEKLSDEASARLQAEVDQAGELFVETVARNRGMTTAKVKATEAGTFSGPAGVEIGFADSVAAPDAAFADLLSSL